MKIDFERDLGGVVAGSGAPGAGETRARRREAPAPVRVRLKTVALPTEHGGWGVALGL